VNHLNFRSAGTGISGDHEVLSAIGLGIDVGDQSGAIMTKQSFLRRESSSRRDQRVRQVPAATELLVGVVAIAGWFAGSAIIVAWLTCLPWLVESASAAANVAATYAQSYSSAETKWPSSNTSRKGDRLVSSDAAADRHPIRPLTTKISKGEISKGEISKDGRKVPVGCEAAFSRLIAPANFSVRCLT
jgi:hypothetical protein